MARRRYVVSGTQGVQDPETLAVVEPGGAVTVDSDDGWTQMQIRAGVLTLETEAGKDEKPVEMTCPLCLEQGKKRAPAFANQGDLEAHYTKAHAGFAVPEWKEGSSA
jgi:hypothetical protein